jgi:transposase
MIAQWKRQATEGMVEVFSGKSGKRKDMGEEQIKELHAKIGQLTVERDFLAKASGR